MSRWSQLCDVVGKCGVVGTAIAFGAEVHDEECHNDDHDNRQPHRVRGNTGVTVFARVCDQSLPERIRVR